MKILASEKLSSHKYKTPEGYLICTDAILARTGKQDYMRRELFGDSCENPDEVVWVDRKPEEVFDESTLSSFENKPITVEHPDGDVNPSNYKELAVGYVRDVRRDKLEDGTEVIKGNLVITDEQTIEEILNGEHTDLSCGYDCEILDEDNPQQRRIRGNHVALCEEGRAGVARIVDSKVKDDSLDKVVRMLYGYGYKFDIKSVGGRRHKITPTEGQNFDKLLEAFDDNGYELLPGKGEQYFYIVDSKVKDSNYIYEFYYNDIDNEDKRMMRKYNLEVVGKSGKDRGQRNLAVKGSLENLKRYAKDWLGYELHPDYLIPESQFAYDMYDSVKDNKINDWTPDEVKQFKVEKRARGYGVYYKGQLVSKYDDYDRKEAEEELARLRKYYYVDSKTKDARKYVYEFYYPDINSEDKRMMKRYGLTILGKSGKDRGEKNLAVMGNLDDLERYCDEWLGYEMHPDYLIEEEDFVYDLYDSKKAKDSKGIEKIVKIVNILNKIK